jgi:hypothetical protein
MLLLEAGLWAWLGYREEWDSEPPAGPVRRFSFRSAGLNVHFDCRNVRHKPQMFRAEWAGWARWNGANYTYQVGQAAHPHWQFEALESLKRDDAAERAATFLSILRREEEEAEPREFSPQSISRENVGELIGMQELSRLHFASAAAWWKTSLSEAHVYSPSSLADIHAWVGRPLPMLSENSHACRRSEPSRWRRCFPSSSRRYNLQLRRALAAYLHDLRVRGRSVPPNSGGQRGRTTERGLPRPRRSCAARVRR